MSQRDEIVSKIAKAASLQEQAAAVAELDAYDRMNREASASAKSVDWADTTIRQTLSPVAVHERSTIATDWLGEISTVASNASEKITVEASMWYRRLSPEVKADSEEFAEQARGMARRIASAHGEQAPALEQEFLQYVSFLNAREAASGLPQVQQVVDSFENKAPQPLPTDVFDNFAPPVAPVNEGVVGTESSTRAPLIDAAVSEAGSPQGVETHHDEAPQPYTYAEVPPGGPQDASAGSEPPLYNQASLFQPTVGISHVATMDDFVNKTGIFAEAASGLDQVQQVVDSFEEPDETELPPQVAFPWILGPDAGGQANAQNGPPPGVNPSVVNRQMNTSEGQERMAAFQRRAAHAAHLAMQDPNSLTEAQRREVAEFSALLQKRAASFPGGLNKQADQWTQLGEQYHGPTPANSPMTTPDPLTGSESAGHAEGRSDWPAEAPDYADDSPSIPPYAKGHAEGYQEAAQADPIPGAATPGQTPPGAGGMGTYQTHKGSKTASATCPNCGSGNVVLTIAPGGRGSGPGGTWRMGDVGGSQVTQCRDCGKETRTGSKTANQYIKKQGDEWVILQKGTGKVLSHHDSEEKANESFRAMEMNKHSGSLKVSASFTSPMDEADPEFSKAYKYAAKWKAGDRLVRQGSAAFEAGLYAGMSDNPEAQAAWVQAHERTAKKHGEVFTQRIAKHREFSKAASRHTGMKVEGAYLAAWGPRDYDEEGPERESGTCATCGGPYITAAGLDGQIRRIHQSASEEEAPGDWVSTGGGRYIPSSIHAWDHEITPRTAKTAATEMDLDTMAPTTSPSPNGDTPINGPGKPGPLAEDGQNPARPGGPAPYQGAPPYGKPAVPSGTAPHGTPQAISDIPGAPVDKAVSERLNPQTSAFRKTVQANKLAMKQASSPKALTAAVKKVPVCNGCGEAFESREVANEAHGKNGCGTREDENTGYKMTPEDEAW